MMEHGLIALLSGENPPLALGELRAILHVLGVREDVSAISDRLVEIKGEPGLARALCERAGYVRSIIAPLLRTDSAGIGSDSGLREEDLDVIRSPFRVSAERIGPSRVDRALVERWLGGEILRARRDLKVDLDSPSTIVKVFIEGEEVVAGILLSERDTKSLESRRPKARPFRHPSAIHPKLARCMVNLTRTPLGGYLLDPFAGTGSIPIEAALLGYRAVAAELRVWIARGCLANLKAYAPREAHVIAGDARRMALRRVVDGVATDPPYGRSTYIGGGGVDRLIEEFLSSLDGAAREDALVVMAYPNNYSIGDLASDHGLRIIESYTFRVHSTLTRVVSVMKRN